MAELYAPLETRLERNRTENRRAHKRVDWATDEALRNLDARYQHTSNGAFPLDLPHFELDVTNITPEESATIIADRFGLPSIPG